MGVSLINGHDDNIPAERCLHCGRIIPEGRLICPYCEEEAKEEREGSEWK